jgi:hypothetical protein
LEILAECVSLAKIASNNRFDLGGLAFLNKLQSGRYIAKITKAHCFVA